LKTNPTEQIVLTAIAAPVAPYIVTIEQVGLATGAMEDQPQMVHTCNVPPPIGEAIEIGDPGIRIKQALDAFGPNATMQSICENDFASALGRIAATIARPLGGAHCVPGAVQPKADGTPDCRVIETSGSAAGQSMNATLPACQPDRGVVPCWEFSESVLCPAGRRFRVCRDAGCRVAGAPTDARTIELFCSFVP
jgi:hypothetical protein